MSRLGKLPIEIPSGTEVKIENNIVSIKGPKGELKQVLISDLVKVEIQDNSIKISVDNKESKKSKAIWGLYWSLIRNMVVGVNSGYEKKLEVVGVGYRVSLSGNKLTLNVGYSHPVEYVLPDGISAQVDGNNIVISGIDKQLVGEVAAQIRKVKKPEPYKGKGIKYSDEIIRRKVGKTAVKGS